VTQTIRLLNSDDYSHMEALHTGIDEDYVKHIFHKLIAGPNRIYGLFVDEKMVSIGGYSVFARHYAMLGRLRTDQRYKGSGLSTALMRHIMNEVLQQKTIQWVGANTQQHNHPAQLVIEKTGLSRQTTLYGAITDDVSSLTSGAKSWNPITDLKRKQAWVDKIYVQPQAFFPLECYYPFPGSADLFPTEKLEQWDFYENNAKTRIMILKTDQKKHHYLHVVYPWNDSTSQPGLWETVAQAYWNLKRQTAEETYIWTDFTPEEVLHLPPDHGFELPSPWILYGLKKTNWQPE